MPIFTRRKLSARNSALMLSIIVSIISAVVLIGWVLDIAALKLVLHGLSTMKANTAICMLLSGITLGILSRERIGMPFRFGAATMAIVMVIIAALTLSEDMFGWELGIDQYLFVDMAAAVESSSPGRMSPSTALGFALVGIALLAAAQSMTNRMRNAIISAVGLVVILIGGMALAGHVSSALTPIHWWNYAGMAIPTAAAFVLLGSGLLAMARSEGGLTWSLDAFTTLGFAIGIVSLFAMASSSYNVTSRLMETAKWVSHTQEVLKEIQEIASNLAELESKQRGYIITGDEHQLDRREPTKAALQDDLDTFRTLIADNSNQQRRLKGVVALIAQRNDFGDQTILARRKDGYAAAAKLISTNKGIELTDSIQQQLKEMEAEEYDLLAVREKRSDALATMTFLLLPLVVFLSVTLLCVGVFFLNTGVRERIRSDDALRQSESRMRRAEAIAGLGNFRVDLRTGELTGSDGFASIFGLSPGDFARKAREDLAKFAHPDDHAGVQAWREAFLGGGPAEYVYRIVRPSGEVCCLEIHAQIERDPGGAPIAMFGIAQDITERKRTEMASIRLAAIVESSVDAIIGKDLNSIITSWNNGAEKIFGFTASAMIGTSIIRLIPADRHDEEIHVLEKISSGESVEHFETLRQTKSGRLIDVAVTVSPIKDATGKVIGASKVARDITERKRTEEAVRRSEILYRTLFDTLIEGFCTIEMVFDDDGKAVDYRFLEINPAFEKQTGLRNAQGKLMRDIAPDHEAHWFEIYGKIALTGEPAQFESEAKALGRHYDVCAYRVGGPESRKVAILFNDITERTRAEIVIAEKELRYRRLFEAAKDGILILAAGTGKITDCNPYLLSLLGYSLDEMLGKELWEIGLFKNIVASKVAFAELQAKDYIRFENMPLETKDGRRIDVEFVSNSYRVSDKRVMQCTIRDISERRKLEAQLRQAQKMEGIGQLAGGVAHDFNNLLTVINGRSQLSMNRFKVGDKTRNDLELIYKTGERAAALTRQLLAFSRQQVLEPIVLDLNAVAVDMDKLLRRLIREDIDLCTVLDPALKRVKADPGQIEQVIMNLVVNARDAMPDAGKLTIETANVELSEEYCRARTEVKPGHYAMLAISDTGHGMDAAVKARIFEPFFTTKPQGKGTGLGLATVFGVVKQSNGHIEVYSEVAKGTTFKVYLPQTEEKPAAIATESELAVHDGREVILVVEDEEGVRELVRDLLEMNGYTVLLANNGKDALQVCQKHAGAINLLVTDVVMPEMGGPELVERMKIQHPETKVLFTSGYTDHAIVRNGSLEVGVAFIQKPFTPANFARKIRDILEIGDRAL